MAQRRMFSKTVTDSARFLRMPGEARLLYYDLGMAADDDGCVEGFTVLQKTGGREEHLRLLEGRGFLKILNEDLVVYLLDWAENNRIRRDRYHRSSYWSLVEQVLGIRVREPSEADQGGDSQPVTLRQPNDSQPETLAQPSDNQPVTECQPPDNQMTTTCLPTGNLLPPEVRLGKDRLGKSSLGQSRIGQASLGSPGPDWADPDGPTYAPYGKYRNVWLCNDEIFDLLPKIDFHPRVDQLSEYIRRTGKEIVKPYRILRDWEKSGMDKACLRLGIQ